MLKYCSRQVFHLVTRLLTELRSWDIQNFMKILHIVQTLLYCLYVDLSVDVLIVYYKYLYRQSFRFVLIDRLLADLSLNCIPLAISIPFNKMNNEFIINVSCGNQRTHEQFSARRCRSLINVYMMCRKESKCTILIRLWHK